MLVRTDDSAARLRNVWLGGQGFEWPFAARYSAWGVWILLALTFGAAARTALPPLLFFLIGVPAAAVCAALLTRVFMRHVTHDRTVRSHLRTFLAELQTPRPHDEQHEYVVAVPANHIGK